MFRIYYAKGLIRTFQPQPGERGPGIVRMLPGWGFDNGVVPTDDEETRVKLHNLTRNQGYAVFLARTRDGFDINDALRGLIGAEYPAGVYEL